MKKLTLVFTAFCLAWCSTSLFARDVNCANSNELIAALADLQDQDNIILTTAGTYIVQDDVANDVTAGTQSVVAYSNKTISIVAADGLASKPLVKGLSFAVTASQSLSITFENLILQACIYKYNNANPDTQLGWYTDHLLDFGSSSTTKLGNIIFRKCEIRNYGQTIVKANSMTGSSINGDMLLITGCIIGNTNSNALATGDALLNMNKLLFNVVTITESTIYNHKTGFYRQNSGVSGMSQTFSMTKCTFYKFLGRGGSGGNTYFVYTNNGNAESSITISDNIFSNILSTEGATAMMFKIDGSALGWFTYINNNVYECDGPTSTFSLPADRRTVENIDPAMEPQFVDAATGNFKLLNTDLVDLELGDPRWLKGSSSVQMSYTGTINIIPTRYGASINASCPIDYAVYNMDGRVLANSATSVSVEIRLASGTYIIKAWGKSTGVCSRKIIIP